MGLIEAVNYKCVNGNPIKVHRGTVYEYYNQTPPKCKECGEYNLEDHEFFYRCSKRGCGCRTEICRLCALVRSDPPILEEKMYKPYLDRLPDQIIRHPPNYKPSWACNSKSMEAYTDLVPSGICQMGISNYKQHKYI